MWRNIAIFLALSASGCELFPKFREQDPDQKNVVRTGAVSPVSQEKAARLNKVGQQIISTNPFLGSAPMFGLIGSKEPEIFHPNDVVIYVSEGLLNQCESDDILAAMLCWEMARINCETQNLKRLGISDTNVNIPTNPEEIDDEQADLANASEVGKSSTANSKKQTSAPPESAKKLAKEWHKNAGYEEAAFKRAEALDQLAQANAATSKQLNGQPITPQWTK
jgi:hypothetical protein